MQNKVNVHARSQRAAVRTIGPVDWVDDIEQSPEPQPEIVGVGEILRGEIELTTRTQGGSPAVIRIPHSILAVLVTVALALIAGGVLVGEFDYGDEDELSCNSGEPAGHQGGADQQFETDDRLRN